MAGRLGVLGGTFDPPHRMHLRVAAAARDTLNLPRVLFVPAGDPWRKAERNVTAATHRLAMTRLAIAAEPAFACSDTEIRRPGPSRTLATVEALRAQGWTALWFILGSDALLALPHWHHPRRLIAVARLAVVARPGAELGGADLEALVPGLADRVDWLRLSPDPLSASAVRARLAAGRPAGEDLPPVVDDYIRRHGLYDVPAEWGVPPAPR